LHILKAENTILSEHTATDEYQFQSLTMTFWNVKLSVFAAIMEIPTTVCGLMSKRLSLTEIDLTEGAD
jgi:hypothetical protein